MPHHHTDARNLSDFLKSLRDHDVPKEQLLYSLGVALLSGNESPSVQSFLNDYEWDPIVIADVPHDVFDLLGAAYQYLNSKMENLKKGIFYTGKELAIRLTNDLSFTKGETLLDPSCGSGSFLFRSDAPPEQLVGVDSDPVGVMISKFNYFIKFPSAPPPKIFCDDFFAWSKVNPSLTFDYIIGNPPFGANIDISDLESKYIQSGESFSYFIEYSYRMLSNKGLLRFIVPESLLNVKRHTDIRDFLLNETNLRAIERFPKRFAGVMSDVYMIELDREQDSKTLFLDSEEVMMDRDVFKSLKNHIFVPLSRVDLQILKKVEARRDLDLSESTFGLGVVTGNNQRFLSAKWQEGREPIYTGKEVTKYRLLTPNSYIHFERESLQQVAADEIYRAPQKLIYKTICKTLRVALDENGSLSTNSANIIIPTMPGYGVVTVLALLNSDLYSFLYLKQFGRVNKIGKEHLMALPFPLLTPEQRRKIDQMTRSVINGKSDEPLQKYIHEDLFALTMNEIAYVQKVVQQES